MVAELLPADLIFIDETSTHTALTRRRARAPRGHRAVGPVPRNHGTNVTLLAALTPEGIGPALPLTGGVTGAAFAAYAARLLAPSLRPGQVVILDNLSAHKHEQARTAIEAVGARLLFLPAYSPDFHPIELAFSKIKSTCAPPPPAHQRLCSPPPPPHPPSTPSPPLMPMASITIAASPSRPINMRAAVRHG
jgi:transposase